MEPKGPLACPQEITTTWALYNTLFNSEELLAPCQTLKLEDYPLLAAHDCIFNTLAATFHIWRPFPPSLRTMLKNKARFIPVSYRIFVQQIRRAYNLNAPHAFPAIKKYGLCHTDS
jgi:hypothetical protein